MSDAPPAPSSSAGWGLRLLVFALALVGAWVLVGPLVGTPPGEGLPWAAILGMTSGAVIATLVALAVFERGDAGAISRDRGARVSADRALRGGGFGVCVFALAFLLVLPAGIEASSDAGGVRDLATHLAMLLVFFLIAAAAEELIFRGYPFVVLERRWGGGVALGVTSMGFALAHVPNPSATLLGIVNVGLAGLLLGMLYRLTRSLWYVIGVHAGWNWAMAGPADVPVSGFEEGMQTPGYAVELGGPAWWSGGDFGPEGGVVATAAFATAILFVRRWGPVGARRAELEQENG